MNIKIGITKLLLLIWYSSLSFSCKKVHQLEPLFIAHPNNVSKRVEYYIKKPNDKGLSPAIILIHGHQNGLKPGGRDFVEWGVLDEFTKQGFIAVSISQPGYGASDGPPDYCGTYTLNAVIAVIEKLEKEGVIDPNQIIIEGISRGAVVAGLVAAKKPTIKGVILISGVFDFIKYREAAKTEESKKSIISAMIEEIGNSDDSLKSRSLINYAKNIKAKTLILNGKNDEKTIPQQAKEFSDKINKYKGNASFVVYKNAGHNIPLKARSEIIDPFISKTINLK